MMVQVSSYFTTTMQNFMLFSDLQKQLSPSPIKTWRLLKQLRDDGRMKDTVSSREQDITQLREVISELSKQNKTLTQQNGWLTNLLVAPKAETEPVRTTKVTDISDDITQDDIHHETQTHQDVAGAHANE